MSQKTSVASIGTITLDMFYYTDEGLVIKKRKDIHRSSLLAFERSAKISAQDFFFACGGGASNSATTFARQGLAASIISAVGEDPMGAFCLDHLRGEGIAMSSVTKLSHATTGTSAYVYNGSHRDNVVFVYRGASSRMSVSRGTFAKHKPSWIYLTSLSGEWKRNLRTITRYVKQNKAQLAWNPGHEQLASGIHSLKPAMRVAKMFMVNLDEAIDLLMKGKHSAAPQPQKLAHALQKLGPEIVIVTMGHKGAYACVKGKILYQPAKIGQAINKTGAGDAFGSGFVAGLIGFKEIRRALKLAMYNSSSVVSHMGASAGALRQSDLKKLHL